MKGDRTADSGKSCANHGVLRRGLPLGVIGLTLILAAGCGDGSNGGGGGGGPQGGEQAPVMAPVDPNPSVVLGSDLLVPISATDLGGAPVTLSASGLPANSYFLPDSGVFCFLATDETQVGQDIPVTFTASNGFLTSSQTVTVHVVRPTSADAIALSALSQFTFEPIGDQSADPHDTFTMQLSASGADRIFYRMFPDPSIAPLVSLDPHTGVFTFSPTDEQEGKQAEITFQACAENDNGDCSQIVQLHETIHLTTTAGPGSCEATRAAFEATLPVPVPTPGRYVVQLVNESNVTLLAGANAAHRDKEQPVSVLPREGTWILPPKGTLTIDIPEAWERTVGHGTYTSGGLGPVFWARTGCRYDIANDLAQCETGDCGSKYDCSKAGLTPPGPKSLAEWTFDDGAPKHNAAPDISTVDGVNISMDIVPVQPYTEDAKKANINNDPKTWLNDPTKRPLMLCGQDRRAGCPDDFAVKRKQLTFFTVGNSGGDDVVGCLSNCGQYKFRGDLTGACLPGFRCPGEPKFDCKADDLTKEADRVCYYWRAFCCAAPKDDPDHIYGDPCKSDNECRNNGSCWDKFPAPTPGVCSCKGFIKNDCPPDVCTLPYSEDKINQPPFGKCSELTNKTGREQDCIGEDFFHEVMPRGLTWPNDPQTYYSDAKAFRIVFAPGGTTVPIADSSPIQPCSGLPDAYKPDRQAQVCRKNAPGKIFAGAQPAPTGCHQFCTGSKKACSVDTDCTPGFCSDSDCPCTTSDCKHQYGCDTGVTPAQCNTWECGVTGQTIGVLCRLDTSPAPTPTATPIPGAPTPTATPGLACDDFPGQVLRLDADDITGLSAGAKVASWPDHSARGNSVSQTNATFQPTWQPSTWNGHATVRFGANGPTALTRSASIILGNGPRTVLVVGNRTTGGDGQTFVDLGTDGDGTEYLFSPEYSLRFGMGIGIIAWRPGTPVGNAPSVISLVQGGTDAENIILYENGAPKSRTSIKSVALNTTGGTTVGHRTLTDFNNKTWALHGDIATVIVFDRALTTGERCACEQQLANKYGLAVPACNS